MSAHFMMTPQERYNRARTLLVNMKRLDELRVGFLSLMRDLRLRKKDLQVLSGDNFAVWVRNTHDCAGDWLGASFSLLCALGEEGKHVELVAAEKIEREKCSGFKHALVRLERERVAWLRRSRKAGITKMRATHHPEARRVLRMWAAARRLEKAEARQERAVARMHH